MFTYKTNHLKIEKIDFLVCRKIFLFLSMDKEIKQGKT